MKGALCDTLVMREFAHLNIDAEQLPDESTAPCFHDLLGRHELTPKILAKVNMLLGFNELTLRADTAIDDILIAASARSTKNGTGTCNLEMHQTKNGNRYYFSVKDHIGIDADSGAVHAVVGTAVNVSDMAQANQLVRGGENSSFADAGFRGVVKRGDLWHHGRVVHVDASGREVASNLAEQRGSEPLPGAMDT